MFYSKGFLHTNFANEESITVFVHNTTGQMVKTINKMPAVGIQSLHLQNGIYFISTKVGHQKVSQKILVFE